MVNRNDEQAARSFQQGLVKHQQSDFSAAESLYKRALQHSPLHLDANYFLGTLYAERGALIQALKFLRQAAAINPNSHMIQNNLGNAYQLSQQFEQAFACYQRALELEPNMPEVYNNLGNICKLKNQLDEAAVYYRRAISLRQDSVVFYCNLGKVLHSAKKFQEAIDTYRTALDLVPAYKSALEGLGSCYMDIDEREQAIACFHRYLEIAPDENSQVRLRLARLNAGAIPEQYPQTLTLATYKKKAHRWDDDSRRPGMEFLGPRLVQAVLERLNLTHAPQLDVLDIGCGTGACGEFLRGYAKYLAGVDLSPHMLAQAQSKNYYDKLDCADAIEYMHKCDRIFDLVVASGVLILFGDLMPMFKTVAGLMRSGGIFVFTLYRSESEPIEVRHNMHFAHTAAYISETAEEVGLSVALLEQEVHEYDFNEPQPGWVVGLRKA